MASTPNDVLVEVTYAFVATHHVRTDQDGLAAFREVFDATLGSFLAQNAQANLWERPQFRDFILDVVGRIAAAATHGAAHPTRVTRGDIVSAATNVMRDADVRNECRDALSQAAARPTLGMRVVGPICAMALADAAR